MAARKPLAAALAALVLATAVLTAGAVRADPIEPAKVAPPLARLTAEAQIAELMAGLRDKAPFGLIQFDDVQVVDPGTASVTPHQSVLVAGRRIYWVGETGKAPKLDGKTLVVDGHGRFLSPGLSDMHIHTSRADGWLLNLAAGVTTVRDMDGFPWMLAARDAVNARRMLGPTDYVAGTIIASQPLDDYAVVVTSPEDARRVVRQQAACGYDFIKVHNLIRQPVFDAVAEQAGRSGLDLVGHVPHDITLDHALHVGRMRTTEHLKGFLFDSTLKPSNEDYAAALAGAETWITPTLYTQHSYERGPWARGVLADLGRYAPPDARREWASLLAKPDAHDLETGALLAATVTTVMGRLVPLKPHWLTGTDAEDYPFALMGFALLDELQMLQAAGLTPAEVLRASTVEAAAALREAGEFGAVAKGMRADLVLTERNPLADTAAFQANQGVMAHGFWLDRPTLDVALAWLAAIYAEDSKTPPVTKANATALIARLRKAQADGFVFSDAEFAVLALALRKAGLADVAARAEGLEITPKAGPCAVALPLD